MIEIKYLGLKDKHVLTNVAPDVFDNQPNADFVTEFFSNSNHHLVVAIEGELVVGFASAISYIHPDKPKDLWINEVGVAPAYQRQGIGKKLLQELLNIGHKIGCYEAWVLTNKSNTPAMKLYKSVGSDYPPENTVMFTFKINGNSQTI